MNITAEQQKKGLAIVFGTIFIDAIGLGIVIPVLPQLLMSMTGENVGQVAMYGGMLLFLYAMMQFICAPFLGSLSDHYGRRPVMLVSLLVFALDYTVMGLAPTLIWLFVGRAIAGVASATTAIANAYVVDLSDDGNRTENIGMISAAWGVGVIMGPVIGGLLVEFGERVPFFTAAGFAFFNFLLGMFLLPETLPAKQRRSFSLARVNPIGALLHLQTYPIVIGLLLVFLIAAIAYDANFSVWNYFTIEKFSWSERQVGYSMAFVGVMLALVQGGVVKVVMPRLGEKRVVTLGLTLNVVGFLGFALVSQGWMLFLLIPVFCIGSLAVPAIRSIMASHVPNNEQGELQGAISSANGISIILSPIIMTQAFSYFTTGNGPIYFPGAPFVLGAGFLALSIFVYFLVMNKSQNTDDAAFDSQDASEASAGL